MKKICCVILAALLLILSACGNTPVVEPTDSALSPEPPHYDRQSILHFYSYEEYLQFFEDASRYGVDESIEQEYDKMIVDYVYSVSEGEKSLIVPYLGDEPIPLRQEDGFADVAFFSSKFKDYGSVWFYPLINDDEMILKIYDLPSEYKAATKGKTYSQFLSEVFPETMNVDNFDRSSDFYSNVYEKDIIVNGTEIRALVYETYDYPECTVFIMSETIIEVTNYETKESLDWLAALDFREISFA